MTKRPPLPRPHGCPSCGQLVVPAAGLYRCDCGKSFEPFEFTDHRTFRRPAVGMPGGGNRIMPTENPDDA